MYNQNPPRSSSPIQKDNLPNFAKQLPPGLSFPDIFQETGDSTRSLLAPLYDDNNNDDDDVVEDDFNLDKENIPKKQSNDITNNSYSSTISKEENDNISTPNTDNGKINVNHTHSNSSSSNVLYKTSEKITTKSERSRANSSKSEKQSRSGRQISNSSSSPSSSQLSSSSSSSSSSTFVSHNTTGESLTSPNTHFQDLKGKTWDDWVLEKAIFEMQRMKLIREKQKEHKEKKIKEKEEKMKREAQAEQNRNEWLKQKLYEMQKQKGEKMAQDEYEKLKKHQEQQLLEEKVKQNYNEWCTKKDEEKNEKHSKKKVDQRVHKEISEQKKLEAENAYKTWLKRTRKQNKTRNSNGGNSNTFDSIYDSPTPSFVNPVPWVSPDIEDDNLSNDIHRRRGRTK